MNSLPQLDWNLIRCFLAVAEHGAVAHAADALGVSQPTLSRHLAALEAAVGASLFTRGARGCLLTAAGEALIAPARQVEAAAHGFSRAMDSQSGQMAGTVRITASEMTSALLLPPILLALRETCPEIQVDLVASNALDNLLDREADIAIRMTEPAQGSVIARHIGHMGLGGYATSDYMARKAVAFSMDTAHRFDWIGYDRNDTILRGARGMTVPLTRASFAFRCDNQLVCWQALLEGMGIGFCFNVIAARHPQLVRVLPPAWIPPVPVWLTAAQELRSNPRVRLVYDHLQRHLAPLLG